MELRPDMPKIRATLALRMPFVMALLATRLVKITEEIDTLAVDAAGNLYVNLAFFQSLTKKEAIFAIAHEMMHILLLHATRSVGKYPKLWNWAGDAVINAILEDKKIGAMRYEEWVWMPEALTMTTEEVYKKLLKNWEDREDEGNGKGGNGKGGNGSFEGWERGEKQVNFKPDVLQGDRSKDFNNPTPVTSEQTKALTDAIAQASQIAARIGGMGADREIKGILTPKADWTQELAEFLSAITTSDYSWSRPNKRHLHGGFYLPSLRSQTLGYIVIAVDTSGSVGADDLRLFAGHINLLLSTYAPSKVRVIYCDHAVQGEQVFESHEPVVLKALGGGGTAYDPIFELLASESEAPELLVYITDGYCSDEPQEPDFPVVWLTTEKTSLPFGKIIKI